MGFENFALSRDIGYLAFALSGAALGLVMRLVPVPPKTRDRIVPVIFLVFSGAVALFALSIIQSQGKIFLVKGFYFVGIIMLVLCCLASRFSRIIGFPLLVLAGFLTVFGGFFLRSLVRIDGPETVLAEISGPSDLGDRAYTVQISKMGDNAGRHSVKIALRAGTELETEAQTGTELKAPKLTIRSIQIRPDSALPFLGGTVFGAIRGIHSGDRALYEFALPLGSFFFPREPGEEKRFLGITSIISEAELTLDHLRPGFPVRVMARPFAGPVLWID
jgi:hypothetical protein